MIDFLRECEESLAAADAVVADLRSAVTTVDGFVGGDTWAGGAADDWVTWWTGAKSRIETALGSLADDRAVAHEEARRRQAEWNREQERRRAELAAATAQAD